MNNSNCSCGNPRFRQRRAARRRQQGFYNAANSNLFIFEAEPFRLYRQPAVGFAGGLESDEQWAGLETGDGTEAFLGGLVRSVSRAAKNVAKTVSRTARDVGRTVSKIDRVIPVSQIVKTAAGVAPFSPMGMLFRAGAGAISAASKGQNIWQGAARSFGGDPATRFLIDTGTAAVRGQNVLKAAKRAAQAGIQDVREQLRFAEMVAPFIPGVGTGVGAALGAANALANGRPITDALIAAARGALPGGAIAQTAFDVAVNLAKGKNLSEAALAAARERLPGGKIGQAAFDAAIALAQGKKIQDAAFQAAGRMLPSSPYATDALAFARRVAAGENIQKAALSVAGQRVFQKMNHLEGVQKAAAAARSALPKGLTAQAAANTAIRSARQNLQQQRR